MEAVILGVHGLLLPSDIHNPSVADGSEQGPLPIGVNDSDAATATAGADAWRPILAELGRLTRLVLLERGPADALEAWSRVTGAADLACYRLWTERLGNQARPPSRLPFRFVAHRLGVPTHSCLYAGCHAGTLAAAERSGVISWNLRQHRPTAAGIDAAGIDAAGAVPTQIVAKDIVELIAALRR